MQYLLQGMWFRKVIPLYAKFSLIRDTFTGYGFRLIIYRLACSVKNNLIASKALLDWRRI